MSDAPKRKRRAFLWQNTTGLSRRQYIGLQPTCFFTNLRPFDELCTENVTKRLYFRTFRILFYRKIREHWGNKIENRQSRGGSEFPYKWCLHLIDYCATVSYIICKFNRTPLQFANYQRGIFISCDKLNVIIHTFVTTAPSSLSRTNLFKQNGYSAMVFETWMVVCVCVKIIADDIEIICRTLVGNMFTTMETDRWRIESYVSRKIIYAKLATISVTSNIRVHLWIV